MIVLDKESSEKTELPSKTTEESSVKPCWADVFSEEIRTIRNINNEVFILALKSQHNNEFPL
jgi:hypothetical protein|tara:strand:+ start:1985 stop:2170 length:186 start_codon:yes stop_codon:yes gene_type:complete